MRQGIRIVLVFCVFVAVLIAFCVMVSDTSTNPEMFAGPVVTVSKVSQSRREYGGLHIEGIARNNIHSSLRRLRIQWSVYDRNHNKLGTASDYISELGPGETWKFSATSTEGDSFYATLDGASCADGSVHIEHKKDDK